MWLDELDAHQCECQRLGETEDSQIPLFVDYIDGVFREIVRTHDNIETESEDNSTVSLLCEICDELRPSDKLMEHQEQCIQEREGVLFWFSLRKRSDLSHFRFSRLHENLLNKGREDDPFTFANFTMEGVPYDLMANVFRDLEDRRWPLKMMRNIWSRT